MSFDLELVRQQNIDIFILILISSRVLPKCGVVTCTSTLPEKEGVFSRKHPSSLRSCSTASMAMSTRRSSDSPPLPPVDASSTAEPRCHWTEADELALINFLLDHKADAGDGYNFKPVTWNAAAVEMLKHTTKGGIKVASKCKAKYVAVRLHTLFCSIKLMIYRASFGRHTL